MLPTPQLWFRAEGHQLEHAGGGMRQPVEYPAMRLLLLGVLVILLAGCQGSQLYTQQDLSQVHQGWNEIFPTYRAFETAYKANDTRGILTQFARIEKECKIPDEIDKRDSIDPNIKLFEASVALDDMCDTVESAYVTWAKPHGYPYDKTVVPSLPADVFIGTDVEVKGVPKLLAHPADLQ